MPRKIPAYKNVVSTAQGTQPALPAPLTEAQLAESRRQFELAEAERKREEALGETKIPHKILTPMELRSRAISLMNERGYDPIRELIKIARNQGTDEDLRVKIHMHLAKFVYPEQKAVDLNVAGDLNLTVNVVKFSTAAGQQLAPNREAIPVRAVEIAS